MITNLLLKFSNEKKTSKLTLCRNSNKTVRQAVRHSAVTPGEYVFDYVLDIHESHPEVRGLLGKSILVFRSKGSNSPVYVYAGSVNMIPLPHSIAVVVPDYLELSAGVRRSVTTLEVKSSFWVMGTRPMVDEAIPTSYRHLFNGPMEDFAEPTEQFKRDEARRRAAQAREAEAAQIRASAAAAEKAQREAQLKAQQRATTDRQRTASQSRPATPVTRPPTARPALRSSRTSSSQIRREDDDSMADFMFMSMFPDVAPLYRPNSFVAWYLWSQNQHEHNNSAQPFAGAGGQFDGGGASGNWQNGVPGFPEAASQRVTQTGEGQHVELLDASGKAVGSFMVTENNGQTQFAAPGGHVFNVAGQSNPTIDYASNDGQRFSWDGQSEPVVGASSDSALFNSPSSTDVPDTSGTSYFREESPSYSSSASSMNSNTAY